MDAMELKSIRPGEIMPISEAQRALGVGQWAWQRRLLPRIKSKLIRMGRRKYVRSDDIIALFDKSAEEQTDKDVQHGTQVKSH